MILLAVGPILTYIITSIYYISIYNDFLKNIKYDYINSIITNMFIQVCLVYLINEPQYYFNLYDIINIPPLLIINDLLFGGFHYLCHKYQFLWKFHSQHHKLTHKNLYGYNAQYSSITDHIVTSLLPVYLSAYIFNFSYISIVIWACFAEYNSVTSHLPFGYHSMHHLYHNVNYGTSIGMFDRIINKKYCPKTAID
jgi:sterol desaturase/sphingolipid hydroxylase (fatty acid hydroxylase superfamily)